MITSVLAVVFGLALLVWSADRFVEGSAATARHFGMPPLSDRDGDRRLRHLGAGDGGFRAGGLSGQPRHCPGQRLRLQHHQHRPDSWADGADQPHRRSFPGAAQGIADPDRRYGPGRLAALGWGDHAGRCPGAAGGFWRPDGLDHLAGAAGKVPMPWAARWRRSWRSTPCRSGGRSSGFWSAWWC